MVRALVGALIVALAVTACDGGDDGDDDDGSAVEAFAQRYAEGNGVPLDDATCVAEAVLAVISVEELADAGVTDGNGSWRVKPGDAPADLQRRYVEAFATCIDPFVAAARDAVGFGSLSYPDLEITEPLVAAVAACFRARGVSRGYAVAAITGIPEQDTPDDKIAEDECARPALRRTAEQQGVLEAPP